MRKALAVAELYKLIYGETDPQKKEMYQELLEQKKKDVLKKQKEKKDKGEMCVLSNKTFTPITCHCDKCKGHIDKYGYNQSLIITIVKNYLKKIEMTNGTHQKLSVGNEMFSFISKDGKVLLNSNKPFEMSVHNKLIELYITEDIREAYKWYRDIFHKRLPI
jgi:hypothetical protein